LKKKICMKYYRLFKKYWRTKRYNTAIKYYNKCGRPFWHSEEVGRYYERCGMLSKVMTEYEYLVNEYMKMKILPLPKGPRELYKLGKWYIKKNPKKAKKYLKVYLSAEERCGTDPAFYLRHKRQAEYLLKKLD